MYYCFLHNYRSTSTTRLYRIKIDSLNDHKFNKFPEAAGNVHVTYNLGTYAMVYQSYEIVVLFLRADSPELFILRRIRVGEVISNAIFNPPFSDTYIF